jgi:hypothetical protein
MNLDGIKLNYDTNVNNHLSIIKINLSIINKNYPLNGKSSPLSPMVSVVRQAGIKCRHNSSGQRWNKLFKQSINRH